jgi:hypothetical protein
MDMIISLAANSTWCRWPRARPESRGPPAAPVPGRAHCSHLPRYDNSPEARGFVESSSLRGLRPSEFFTRWRAARAHRHRSGNRSQGTRLGIVALEDGVAKYVKIALDRTHTEATQGRGHTLSSAAWSFLVENEVHISHNRRTR